jgi:hypothetical protein
VPPGRLRVRSAVLKVASVIVPEEFDYLLNPIHPEWDQIQIKAPIVYPFDSRLARRKSSHRPLQRLFSPLCRTCFRG